MKTAFVCAVILTQIAAAALASGKVNRCVSNSAAINPAPVAELTHNDGVTVEGLLLRVTTAPEPIQMINPGAPPEYGSARNLVVFTDDRSDNLHKGQIRPNGIRLLTLRPPFW
jgi:hypothetical protein